MKVTKPFTITGAHIAVLIIVIIVSIIVIISVEKRVSQSKASYFISSDSILNSATIPDSIKVQLFSDRLKNLEKEMFNRIIEEHHLNKDDSTDIMFIKRKILEIEE